MTTMNPSPENRRGFLLQFFTLLGGACVVIPPLLAGAVSFFNPLRQKQQGGGWFKLAPLAALPEDGTPKKYPVIAARTDAWNRFPDEPIGAVFLRRRGDAKVEAFQAACPHLACAIAYQTDEKGGFFRLPLPWGEI